ncbi:MAG: hypothetical protein ACOCVF_03890 [bacterium]
MDLRSLQTMSPDEFKQMMNDIGKGYKIADYESIEPLHINLHPKKMMYGFRCLVEGQIKAVYEFKDLIKNVAICDWLDYHNFARPKWTPEGMTMKDTIVSGYERAEAKNI